MPKKKAKTAKPRLKAKARKLKTTRQHRSIKAKPKKSASPKPVGKVTHFYDKICVGIVRVASPIKVGEVLRFKGKKGELVQAVTSIQFDHKPIDKAPKGKEVGIKVSQPVNEGDLVFRA